MPHRVLFVCLGNICRSPLAEGVFRARVAGAGRERDFHIDSAGLVDTHAGELADPRTRAEAAGRGLQLTHRSRPFTAADWARFDWVLGMNTTNLAELERRRPAHFRGHLGPLRAFDPAAPPGAAVPDPYYGGPDGFVAVHDLIRAATEGLFAHLAAAPPPPVE